MPSDEATLYVGNLPWQTTEDDLARLFGQFGSVARVRVIQDGRSGRSQGYGFVELATVEQAEAVCAALHGCLLDGRCLEVRPARPRSVTQQLQTPPAPLSRRWDLCANSCR